MSDTAQRERVERALRIANAALMEVGRQPVYSLVRSYVNGRDWALGFPASEADEMLFRAGALAAMAVRGPEFLMRCRSCALRRAGPGCTTARDILRGHLDCGAP